jgi:hypothetical protein
MERPNKTAELPRMMVSRPLIHLTAFSLLLLLLLASATVDTEKVVIILSHGRSGSTELCNIVERITHSFARLELFGSTGQDMAKLADPLAKMTNYLEKLQAEYPGKTVGFKWKPYFLNEGYEKAWQWVAENRVKVVYNYRNPLDVIISSIHMKEEGAVTQCSANNPDCAKRQQAMKVEVNVTEVLGSIEHQKRDGIEQILQLSKKNINYYDVTYEAINHGEMADRVAYVQALADFVQPGFEVTEDVFEVRIQFIGHEHQRDGVSNYAELEAALKGTRYWRYLH